MNFTRKRSLRFLIPLILLVGLVIFLSLRWKVWFSNLPEVSYTPSDTIDRLTLTPGQDICHDVTVSWRAGSEPAKSWVVYTSDSMPEIHLPAMASRVESRGGVDVFYSAHLKGLDNQREYKIQVYTDGCSNTDSLTIAFPHPDSTLRLMYLGDLQDIDLAEAKKKLDSISRYYLSTDLYLQVGDLIERPMNSYWDLVYRSVGETLMKRRFVATPGNHEVIKGFRKKIDPRWKAQFNYPLNGPAGQEGLSYYIDHPHCRIVSLNSNHLDRPLELYRQLSWLDDVLGSASQPFLIVMMHHSVKPVRGTRSHPIMYSLVRPILERHKVDLVLAGHDHAYARTTHPDKDAYRSTTPVYLISSFSGKCYENGFSPIFDRLGSGTAFYSLIELTDRSLDFSTYTIDQQLTDHFRLLRPDKAEGQGRVPSRFEELGLDLPEYLLFDQFAGNEKGRKKRAAYQEALKKRLSNKH
ncbi:purple acid phosphatase [Porphyromonas crevioricanis JCM 15906]|uniref:Purple acid phosphatase n=1 Tax=Porphyromonas crevioricanis JCM 15906 TaxID=1305617 RepID=T1DRB2_9PORP|nr:metallophosphoesterase family protein [Porphyromonas crevioricanis]GAD05180.1 purple acid phosphatase [Porphyromonas crevioricanis JCM 15906]SKA00114.1 Calcineurin-like phosphoesterase [Porphyromonas crevioricanis]